MATMVIEVYDALREAGASEAKSQAAAKALADYDSRFNRIETELVLIKWMVGLILAGVLSLIMKTYFH